MNSAAITHHSTPESPAGESPQSAATTPGRNPAQDDSGSDAPNREEAKPPAKPVPSDVVIRALCCAALLLGLASPLPAVNAAGVPGLLSYQGRITLDNTNYTGTGRFKFALVNAAGTTTHWSNDGSSVAGGEPSSAVPLAVSKGLFSVNLGDTSLSGMTQSVPAGVFTNAHVELAVWFSDTGAGFTKLTPNLRLTAGGYALNAARAESVADGAVALSSIADGVITSAKLAPNISIATTGTVTATKLIGGFNSSSTGTDSTVSGGYGNTASGNYAVVAGGYQNTVSDLYSAIIGGEGNRVNGSGSFIGAGRSNRIYSANASVVGGYNNTIEADANNSVIVGGLDNQILGDSTAGVIGGGTQNTITNGADYAAIPGGQNNVVGESWGFAAGRNARAVHQGAFVWADSAGTITNYFTSTAANQFLIRAAGGVGIGTNNPQSALHVNGTVAATAFSGDGSGLTNLNASNLAGTINVNGGYVGIGTNNPSQLLELASGTTNAALAFTAPLPAVLPQSRSPQGAANLDTGAGSWSNPGNALVSDDVYAAVGTGFDESDDLLVTNFNVSIPTGAQIVGVTVQLEMRISGGESFVYVQLTPGGDVKQPYLTETSDVIKTVGGSTDLWGNSLSASTVNNNSFGVFISTLGFGTVSLDAVSMTVYYVGSQTASYTLGAESSTGEFRLAYGTDLSAGLFSVATNGDATVSGGLNVDSGTLYVDSANNRVGIGTNAPSTALHVVGTVTGTSFSGSGASLTSLNAANVSSGTLSDSRLSSNVPFLNGTNVFTGTNRFTGVAIVTNSNNQISGTFSGSGASLTSLNAANVSSGTLSDSRLSSNVPLLNGTNVFSGTNRFTGVAIVTNANNQFTGSFTGNGSGLTNLNGSNIASGTVSDSRLSSNVPLLNGTNVFSGTNRFTGVAIVTNSNNQISGTFSGSGASLTSLNAANVSSGTLSDSRLSSNVPLLNGTNVFSGTNRFTGVAIVTNANNQFTGSFTGNGSGLTNLNGSNIASGTVSDSRLSSNVPRLNGTNVFSGTNRFTGVAIVTNANSQFTGAFTGNGASLTNIGSSSLADNAVTSAKIVDGTITGSDLSSSIAVNTSGSITGGSLTVDTDTLYVGSGNNRVGLGTTAPEAKLHLQQVTGANDSVLAVKLTNGIYPMLVTAAGRSGFNSDGTDVSNSSFSVRRTTNETYCFAVLGLTYSPLFVIKATNGAVAIGSTPSGAAKLEVQGSDNETLSYGYLNSSGNTGTSSGANDYSIYASARIAATEFNAFSDARIKNVKGRSDSAADLKTLMDIEVADYTFKDTVAKGSAPQKKAVAQQVEKVYPQAVSKLKDVVPDIFQTAEVKGGWVKLILSSATRHSPLPSKGDRVRLITEKKTDLYEVLDVNETGFRVDLPEDGKVFVYGREVDDFRTVDYEAIAMLNVSATQEQQRQIERLQTENAALQARLAVLENSLAKLLAEQPASAPQAKSAASFDTEARSTR